MRKIVGATDDVAEGMAARRDKRKPDWRAH
jgi:1,4-dihydroxy-2-naphthoyl-CoA synthase